jgi:hypothetical protein
VTIHCSSREARYWMLPRGSIEEILAKRHWDRSRKQIFLIPVQDVQSTVLV